MLYRLFKYLLPFVALASLLIYLGGNLDLYNGFSRKFLMTMSNLEIKNPANDIYPLLQELDRLRGLSNNFSNGSDIFTILSSIYQLGFSGITVGFSVIRCIALVLYDVVFNIVQFIRVLLYLTGIPTITIENGSLNALI